MAQSETGHVWEMIKDNHAGLLITHDRDGMDARPMATTVRREEGAIYILANKQEDSDRQIQFDRDVALSFQNGASFVVVYGGRKSPMTVRRFAICGMPSTRPGGTGRTIPASG